MTRGEILELVRSHLASELEIEPESVEESTHFREDLDADSFDLVTLVMELEDTYGVRIPDEEAARIVSVGQAVDYILAYAPQAAR
ncbi:acyl carrier protein [soil metagenome]